MFELEGFDTFTEAFSEEIHIYCPDFSRSSLGEFQIIADTIKPSRLLLIRNPVKLEGISFSDIFHKYKDTNPCQFIAGTRIELSCRSILRQFLQWPNNLNLAYNDPTSQRIQTPE